MTYREFTNLFFTFNNELTVEQKFCNYLSVSENSEEFQKAEWVGIFLDSEIGMTNATPAQILQAILEKRWTLGAEDKDMIVMQHQFVYDLEGSEHELHSSFVTLGEDQTYTGMAKTVGLPVGIATKLILNGVIKGSGVKLPVSKDVYKPVLAELEQFGIEFIEEEIR